MPIIYPDFVSPLKDSGKEYYKKMQKTSEQKPCRYSICSIDENGFFCKSRDICPLNDDVICDCLQKMDRGSQPLTDDTKTLAFFAGYFPQHLLKLRHILDKFSPESTNKQGLRYPSILVRIIDLGCGPGTATIAFFDWAIKKLSSFQLYTTCLLNDVAASPVNQAEHNVINFLAYSENNPFSPPRIFPLVHSLDGNIEFWKKAMEGFLKPELNNYDIKPRNFIFLSNVLGLNYINTQQAKATLEVITSKIPPDEKTIIIVAEPSLSSFTENLDQRIKGLTDKGFAMQQKKDEIKINLPDCPKIVWYTGIRQTYTKMSYRILTRG